MAERPFKGITFVTLDERGVELVDRDGVDVVRIPVRHPDGTLHNHLCVPLIPRPDRAPMWYEPKGLPALPLGLDRLRTGTDAALRAALLLEGVSDWLTSCERFADVTADSTIRGWDLFGIPGASAWKSRWAPAFSGYGVIYVAGDGDAAGRAFNDRVRADIPRARILRLLDGEDVRSLVQGHGPEALDRLIDDADRRVALRATLLQAQSLDEWAELMCASTEVRDDA